MLEHEADDENSSVDNDEHILQLMDGIAIHSQTNHDKTNKLSKNQTVRHHKISKAERNLMNNYQINFSNKEPNNLSSHRYKSLERWKGALMKFRKLKDPWNNFEIDKIIPEKVERYIFNSFTGSWLQSVEYKVKMESKPFNRGAMRECFRLKKMSSLFKKEKDWYRSGNYVAKRYIELVDDSVYYEDVKLQMDAKLWGQEYSRQLGVIKKVDICQMSVIKFVDRPGQPLYHLEHFIEGDYIKYNSNSGFVDENSRNTPQAFSHFTFERSGHKLIVVDIQGVGDLYTDPQIHTYAKIDYGDGNLGPRGMALFFHSHVCNPICSILGLQKFDLSKSESEYINRRHLTGNSNGTVAIRNSEKVKSIYEENEIYDGDQVLMSRLNYDNVSEQNSEESSLENSNSIESNLIIYEADDGDDECSEAVGKLPDYCRNRLRSSEYITNDDSYNQYFINKSMEHRSSCVVNNLVLPLQTKYKECILGQIHHELARLHSSGKFITDNKIQNINWEAVLFHEELAAKLGYLESMCNLSRFYLDIDRDSMFENCVLKLTEIDKEKGIQYMIMAAEFGDRRSMIFLGDHYRKEPKLHNWYEAYKWYERAITSIEDSDNSGGFDSVADVPLFEIKARMAEIKYIGGYGLEQDLNSAYDLYSQAADHATMAGNGRCATKYFTIAEEILLKLGSN